MIQQNIIQDEPHVKETLLKLCDEIRPNLILTTGGTRNSLYDISPEFNQSIDPRPEYIRVIIIEWSIKSSIPIARIVSLDTQRSLLSARRCKGLYDYSQQTD
ncbi:unnamed protein product [Rotaria magnacalcarata]|uniref:Uncharacterized protein n=1 Tax=Rotaria magnacalcarata TaxID=392030 RepID=A0A816Y2G7_9BILA|nr:unnamed protein product [Rotaria magnacalcarata]